MPFDRFALMTRWLQASTLSIEGIVLVIFAIFCEYNSSSFSRSLREGRSAQKSPN